MPTRLDLHLHTARHSPDSAIDPFELLVRLREERLNGVVITEHDWLWSERELDELRAAAPDLLILAGIEVSTRDGHFLAHGVTDPQRVPAGIGVVELCREVHRQGGAVVAAHPFRWGQPFDEITYALRPELDGLELRTSNMDESCRLRAEVIWKAKGWTGLGSSDAHDAGTIGHCYTEFAATIRDQRDLIEALRSGQATACDRLEPLFRDFP